MSWETAPLSALGLVGRGRSRHRPRNDPSLYGGKYPFFQTGDVTAAEFYLSAYSQTYSEKGLAQSKIWEADTLCITIAANIAETAILKAAGCFPDSIVGFRADESKSDVRFVKYALDVAKRDFQTISKGTTQDNLSVEKLLSIELPAPPLKIQCRIADILSAYDDLIENNTRRIVILEEMARRLFDEWFARAAEAHTLDGSIIGTVSEVAAYINRGIAPKYDEAGASLVINQKCIRSQRLSLDPARRQSKSVSTDKIVCAGDVLVNSTGVGTLGRVAQVFDVPPGTTVDTHVTIVRPKPEVNPVWFGLALLNKQTHFEEAGIGSTGQTELSRTRIADTELLIPTPERAERFGETVGPMREETYSLEQANTNLRTTRDLLLPKLISGEIEVRVAENALEAAAG